jgi:membrane protease YdiL (CAAX protease family)
MNGTAAPPLLLALRFVAALGVLTVGKEIVEDGLVRRGWLEPANVAVVAFLIACAAVVAFAAWQRPGVPWRPARPAFVIARYVPFAAVWLGVLLAYLAAARAAGLAVPAQDALRRLAAWDPSRAGDWLFALVPTVGAPLAEEIVFRGYLQQALLGVMRPVGAIAITAALFGAVHTLPYALPIGMLGGFFGWLAYRCGSLWPAVIAHAVHNALTTAVVVAWPETLELLFPR